MRYLVNFFPVKSLAVTGKLFIFAPVLRKPAEIAQLVEHNLAKVRVASSSLVFRSKQKADNQTIISFFISAD